ncbi:vomeronasal type-2 receptor 26-like isoform X2 [Podarcis raffonei]|uniref:vomeronasal type-2 receptor 26-like isoform X2 n=1 Tax=Podarcis raffonei TaxID=65483 RepID=UPI0023295C4C|nr:vomeronasal type-2 receptor 26-like isoform X2 [Podarcis raffonei]
MESGPLKQLFVYSFICSSTSTNPYPTLSPLFAIQEINQNPKLLPNVTLGYSIYEAAFDVTTAADAMLDSIPSYSCGGQNNVLAAFEETATEISSHISRMLSIYKMPQISLGSTAYDLKGKKQFPFIFWMAPKQETQYMGIVKLLLHFRWTWVGLFVPDNDNGERFLSAFTPLMIRSGICAAFLEKMPFFIMEMSSLHCRPSVLRQVKVFIYYGDSENGIYTITFLQRIHEVRKSQGLVWITTDVIDIDVMLFGDVASFQPAQGSLSLVMNTKKRTEHGYYPHLSSEAATAAAQFWSRAFNCSCSNKVQSVEGWTRCTEKEQLETFSQEEIEGIWSQDRYNIYYGIQLVAQALNAAYSSRSKWRLMAGGGDRLEHQRLKPWQVCPHPFLPSVFHHWNPLTESIPFVVYHIVIVCPVFNWTS